MEPIIEPVDKALLREEIGRAKELEEACRGAIKVYCIDSSFPTLLREIGRLREIAFRKGYITRDQLREQGLVMRKNEYGQYLIRLAEGEAF